MTGSDFRVIHRVWTTRPQVALTFDDGDSVDDWRRLLDILAGYGVKASFFCLGIRVRDEPGIARRTVAEGHAIGSHGWDHARLRGVPDAEVRSRLMRDRAIWWRVARSSSLPFFRPPYGAYDSATLAAASVAGYTRIVLWDVDPQDWTRPGPQVICRRVLEQARAGSIVCMHVVDQTADALPSVIEGLRHMGLEPVSLPVLLNEGTLVR